MKKYGLNFLFLIYLTILTACPSTEKVRSTQKSEQIEKEKLKNEEKKDSLNSMQKENEKESLELNKNLADHKKFNKIFNFLASVENEVFKIVLKDKSPSFSFWQIVYSSLEIPWKRSAQYPLSFSCKSLLVKNNATSITIWQNCIQPYNEIVRITFKNKVLKENNFLNQKLYEANSDLTQKKNNLNQNQLSDFKIVQLPDSFLMEVKFEGEFWHKYSGQSAVLSNLNKTCSVEVEKFKVMQFSCEHITVDLSEGRQQLSVQELKVSEFKYNKNLSSKNFKKEEIVFVGSIFKDLLEKRKIKLTIPIQGSIQLYEKELKVIDEFAEVQQKYLLEEPEKPVSSTLEVHNQQKNKIPKKLQTNDQQETQDLNQQEKLLQEDNIQQSGLEMIEEGVVQESNQSTTPVQNQINSQETQSELPQELNQQNQNQQTDQNSQNEQNEQNEQQKNNRPQR